MWRNADPRESIRKLVSMVFHARKFNPGMQRILWERFFKDREFRGAMEAIENRVQGAIRELLSELARDGRLRIDDLATAAYVIQLSVEWVSSRLILSDAAVEVDAAVETASDMISRFLFNED